MSDERTTGDGMTFGTPAEVQRQHEAQDREATRQAVFTQLGEDEEVRVERVEEARVEETHLAEVAARDRVRARAAADRSARHTADS
jgi:hypothetical protein